MPRLIYIETSIPSFYFDTRAAVELRARRNWTRRWWDEPLRDDERVTSSVVLEELERAPETKTHPLSRSHRHTFASALRR